MQEQHWYMVAMLLFALARIVLSGIKNGVQYARNHRQAVHRAIKPFVDNLHWAEGPASIAITFVMFWPLVALMRLSGLLPLEAITVAGIITLGLWQLASPLHQGFINLGSLLPFIDPNEDPKTEIWGTGRKRYKLIWGKGRYVQPVFGLVLFYLATKLYEAFI